jgi:putative ABC transport system permease protein
MYVIQAATGGHLVQGFDPPKLVPWSAALALASLSLSGIFAGLYPASKAAALEPVEALRRE